MEELGLCFGRRSNRDPWIRMFVRDIFHLNGSDLGFEEKREQISIVSRES